MFNPAFGIAPIVASLLRGFAGAIIDRRTRAPVYRAESVAAIRAPAGVASAMLSTEAGSGPQTRVRLAGDSFGRSG